MESTVPFFTQLLKEKMFADLSVSPPTPLA